MRKTFLLIAMISISAIAVQAQINPDPTSPQPQPTGIPLPTKTSPHNVMDTSRAAHHKKVKPPKEPNYDNKSVTPKGELTKKSAKKIDEKDVPKK